MSITIESSEWHRNGGTGEGFHAILFRDPENEEAGLMYAALFEETKYCAVISLDLVPSYGVTFGRNSWRGDHYESALRASIEAMEQQGPSIEPTLGVRQVSGEKDRWEVIRAWSDGRSEVVAQMQGPAAAEAAAAYARGTTKEAEATQVLRSVEWVESETQNDSYCPRCHGAKSDGHKDDCALAEVLR